MSGTKELTMPVVLTVPRVPFKPPLGFIGYPAADFSYQIKSCSECQQDVKTSDRKEDIGSAGQTDRVTERQNDSMAYSRAAKEPALVIHPLVLYCCT